MFLDFLYNLRDEGVAVGTHEWLALVEALLAGAHGHGFLGFYHVARAVLVHRESDYDAFDRAFARTFRGIEAAGEALLAQLEAFLRDPARHADLDPALRAALEHLSRDEVRRRFFERLAEQRERHEGGSHWIGTGGTSPFGQGGTHPTGVRVGGQGGGRSAMAVADARRFAAYRTDRVLDTRQIAVALRKLRRMGHEGRRTELDLDSTVDRTARNCGDLEVVLRPPRKNRLRVLLLLDVGGSMSPHADRVEKLFSAAKRGGGFAKLDSYYFHNCVYGKLYRDADFLDAVPTDRVMREHDPDTRLVVVGDAYMHPMELTFAGSSWWTTERGPSGYTWLGRLADRFVHNAWLNPEPERLWRAPSIAAIARIFSMFPLTLEGIGEMVAHLRRPPDAVRRALWAEIARGRADAGAA
ncbi:MAG: VWA domain-containing protein [Deltaproteobacteria bacterium]|nr:MAG: VWA domain-containing protein [Deltaproteobacteria bacterium]